MSADNSLTIVLRLSAEARERLRAEQESGSCDEDPGPLLSYLRYLQDFVHEEGTFASEEEPVPWTYGSDSCCMEFGRAYALYRGIRRIVALPEVDAAMGVSSGLDGATIWHYRKQGDTVLGLSLSSDKLLQDFRTGAAGMDFATASTGTWTPVDERGDEQGDEPSAVMGFRPLSFQQFLEEEP